MRSWIATVASTEVGFEGVGEDWAHELMARDYLAGLRRRSASDWPERWDDVTAPSDERFLAATVETRGQHLASSGESGWRQQRSPRHSHVEDRG